MSFYDSFVSFASFFFVSFSLQLFECLLNKQDLSEEEAEGSLDFLLRDGSESLISAFLVLLRAKGENFEEVMQFNFPIFCSYCPR